MAVYQDYLKCIHWLIIALKIFVQLFGLQLLSLFGKKMIFTNIASCTSHAESCHFKAQIHTLTFALPVYAQTI